jgi:arylsulfatase A-like enzyme
MMRFAGHRWFVSSFVTALLLSVAFLYATYEPPPLPRVNVRWSEQVTQPQREALEATYHLAEPENTGPLTWQYEILDTSTGNIRRLVQDPVAEDTHMIDRAAFRLVYPTPLSVFFRFLAWSSLFGVIVALGGAPLRRPAERWWRALLDNRAPLSTVERTARSFVFLVVASYFYMTMEWLFFATKPSFMSSLTTWDVLSISVTTPLALIAAAVPFWGAAALLLAVGSRVRPQTLLLELGLFVAPAAITAAAALLLLDNFTYVLLEHNLGLVQGFGRYGYAALVSGVLVALVFAFERRSRLPFWSRHPRAVFVATGMLVVVSFAVAVGNAGPSQPTSELSRQFAADRPANVLILSTDGLNAERMSAYGYERDTTPFISALLPELLVAENHLSNNSQSAGSIGALLTGKLSTATRVFDAEDAFVDDDVFQHLPRVLREWGYSNVDIGLRFFADAHDLNMRHAFHVGTGRELKSLGPLETLRPRLTSEAFFLDLLLGRIGSRLRHAFGVEDFVDPLSWQILGNDAPMLDDSERIAEWRSFIEASPQPFFAHLHLMGTHGAFFDPTLRHFSEGIEQTDPWMTDFYDDSILQFDAHVADVLQILKDRGEYENTLIIINSDHGSRWRLDRRLPLLIRFPGKEHVGRITWNTQRVDIAPTIVDYLGAEVPAWMTGHSLIGPGPDGRRQIFSFVSTETGRDSEDPPFYNLQTVQVAVGDRLYALDLDTTEIHTTRLDGHTDPLEESEVQTVAEVRQDIVRHLSEHAYDVSGLEAP